MTLLEEMREQIDEIENTVMFLLDTLPDEAPPDGVADLMTMIENIRDTLQKMEDEE